MKIDLDFLVQVQPQQQMFITEYALKQPSELIAWGFQIFRQGQLAET